MMKSKANLKRKNRHPPTRRYSVESKKQTTVDRSENSTDSSSPSIDSEEPPKKKMRIMQTGVMMPGIGAGFDPSQVRLRSVSRSNSKNSVASEDTTTAPSPLPSPPASPRLSRRQDVIEAEKEEEKKIDASSLHIVNTQALEAGAPAM
eukprot:TRINITY_DN686_c0_g1_i1.p1 TRINITY_DN686_c0_g1~~TRINITY_DN686_c0_g1_i1.p1  ORF type:complete len:148 (-),score=63.19 TRINITY_DN686_c0_g1_i1:130-573(-)